MKRILFMHQASSIGGGSYCLLNVVKSIDNSKFEPVVALKSEGPLADELRKLNVRVVFFSQMTPIPYNRSLWSWRSLMAYYRADKSADALKILLKENNIDIMYLNNMMLYRYLKPAKETGVKTIIHIREHWPLDEHKEQLEWARKCVYQYADKMVAINKYSATIFPQKEATVVYDWIDMDSRFENSPLSDIFEENMTDKRVYLYTGGVQRIKGAVEVITSFTKCIEDSDARLLVIGINPYGYISKVKQLLASMGVKSYFYKVREAILADSRIHCIPPTYMLAHIMQQCYCNLSYFTIPHANLAMAECEIMGTPSIASETEESLEYSFDGSLSSLYEINNLASFQKAIMEFPNECQTLQDNLLRHSEKIKDMFSPEKNISKLNKTITDLAIC